MQYPTMFLLLILLECARAQNFSTAHSILSGADIVRRITAASQMSQNIEKVGWRDGTYGARIRVHLPTTIGKYTELAILASACQVLSAG